MKRRDFVSTGTSAALLTVAPAEWLSSGRSAARRFSGDPGPSVTLRDSRIKALALRAIDAAKSAGAHYADVRLTNTIKRNVDALNPTLLRTSPMIAQEVELGLSVRALVNGYWGWAATPIVSIDEAVRVARLAVQFATVTASRSKPYTLELAPTPAIHDGEWITPVKTDPFDLDVVEIHDWLYGMDRHIADLGIARGASASIAWMDRGNIGDNSFGVRFQKQERVFASTDGALLTQTIVTTAPQFTVPYRNAPEGVVQIPHFNMPVQAGWERITDTPVIELFQRAMDQIDALPPPPPIKPLDIGRYDVVFSVDAVMQLISQTFGVAAQVDRALGYWANSDGTSYLGPDPLAVLSTQVASPLVTVTAERSHPLGLATVKWDDEGVAPEDVVLVKGGTLVDYQTTREQAPWLAPWYNKLGRPVRSHGHAAAPSALEEPLQHTPNLALHPGNGAATEESLLRELEHGLYIPSLNALEMDWQSLNGFAVLPHQAVLEIRQGKPVSIVQGGRALIFNTKELWKNLETLGGAASAVYGYVIARKGDPVQWMQHSVGAVPIRIKQLAIIDPSRRA